MLNVEEIKKIFEFVEVKGFTADNLGLNNIHGSCFGWGLLNGEGNDLDGLAKWMYIYCPLFLQRVIEGINALGLQDDAYEIRLNARDIEYFTYGNGWETLNYDLFETIDQAKEQAIKYILEKLK